MNIINKLTLKTLGKNKVRTLVTIIGIILSVSMLTAVTTGMSTLKNFLINYEIEQTGDWYGVAYDISSEKLKEVAENPEVTQLSSLQKSGYAFLEDSRNEDKPYLFIGGMDEVFTREMPVYLYEGRLPQDSSEIILPEHLEYNGGVKFSLDDTITLQIGQRVSDGYILTQSNPLLYAEDEEGLGEELVIKEERTFKVVGFYKRPNFENYSAPGYTALTIAEETDQYTYDVYFKVDNPQDIYAFMHDTFPDYDQGTNDSLLRFTGLSDQDGFNAVLYSLSAILMGIIMFGSISLIYNAFSISVSERTKQFGLLSSIGATRKQMSRSVIFEALFLSLIGIPLGLLAGVIGMKVTFDLLQGTILTLFADYIRTELTLYVSYGAIIMAAIVGLITVLISAYIPARRAFRVSAIEAIRMSQDIKIKPKKLKTSKLLFKLFGVEGMIAQKNFKRSKKRYRATVISLFLSIVLFISASSFSAYLIKATTTVFGEINFDIVYSYNADNSYKASVGEVYNVLRSVDGVTDSSYSVRYYPYFSQIKTTDLDSEYSDHLTRNDNNSMEEEFRSINIQYIFMNDEAYESYLAAEHIEKDAIYNEEELPAIVYDYTKQYNSYDGRYYTFEMLDRSNNTLRVKYLDRIEGYYLSSIETDENQVTYYEFINDEGEVIRIPEDQIDIKKLNIPVGAYMSNPPMGLASNQIMLIYPLSSMENVLGWNYSEMPVEMYFKVNNNETVYKEMHDTVEDMGLSATELFNYGEIADSDKAIRTIINVFSYGFIVLISLIAAANVFNTISTNIGLRRREFAMLKSIGMTKKMFNRMMNFECLLYGLKALAYGIPVSVGITYLIFKSISGGVDMKFFIPWYSLVIAVGSVFAVVFATMIYAMRKIKRDNPIDALKLETL